MVRSSGQYRSRGSSRPTRPRSTSVSTQRAAKGLVTEYGITRVSRCQGRVRSSSAYPPQRSTTQSPPYQTANDAPAPDCSASTSANTSRTGANGVGTDPWISISCLSLALGTAGLVMKPRLVQSELSARERSERGQAQYGVAEAALVVGLPRDAGQVRIRDAPGEVRRLHRPPEPPEGIQVPPLVLAQDPVRAIGGEERGRGLRSTEVHHRRGDVVKHRSALRAGPVDEAGDAGAVVVEERLGGRVRVQHRPGEAQAVDLRADRVDGGRQPRMRLDSGGVRGQPVEEARGRRARGRSAERMDGRQGVRHPALLICARAVEVTPGYVLEQGNGRIGHHE